MGMWMSQADRATFVDWAAEPDHKELTAAGQMLQIDPARTLPRLISLAERGSSTSMVHIGDAHMFGLGTKVDPLEAEKWYRRAADRGSVFGHYDLATLYLTTNRIHEAREGLEFSAARNYAPALNQLGRMYLSGVGAEKDLEKARTYLERASAAGHISGEAGLARLLMKRHWSHLTRLRGVFLMIHAQIFLWVVLIREGFSSERLR